MPALMPSTREWASALTLPSQPFCHLAQRSGTQLLTPQSHTDWGLRFFPNHGYRQVHVHSLTTPQEESSFSAFHLGQASFCLAHKYNQLPEHKILPSSMLPSHPHRLLVSFLPLDMEFYSPTLQGPSCPSNVSTGASTQQIVEHMPVDKGMNARYSNLHTGHGSPVDVNCHPLGTRTFSTGSSYYIQNHVSWHEPYFPCGGAGHLKLPPLWQFNVFRAG